jgi:hypothetical protein
VHTNFADDSACLTADNIRNEVVNNSQITGGVENAVPLHVDRYLSQLNVSLKNTGTTVLLALSLDGSGLHGLHMDSVNSLFCI